MKLLCVVPSYWPAFKYGGTVYCIHTLNKVLVKKGIDVTVHTTNAGLDAKTPVNHQVNVDGVKVYYFSFIKLFESFGSTGWQFSWKMTNTIRRTLKTFELVYVNSIWNYPAVVTTHYCIQYRKPYIIFPHGMLYPYMLAKKAWKKWPYHRLVVKRSLQNAAAINYTTMDEAEKCHSFLGLDSKFFIVPNGIDLSEFNSLPSRENLRKRYHIAKYKKIILFLGRIHWKKGLDVLIDAYIRLAKKRNDVNLLIVGPDEEGYGEKIKKLIRKNGLEYVDNGLGNEYYEADSRITFTGMLTGQAKLEVLAGSDIFVLPSYSENFGMAVIEALACGIPTIISNNVGIHKEVKQNNAGIVTETDVGILQRDMETLLDNESLTEEMAENGKRKVADRMIELNREIIGEPSRV
jgi:glycosyltransferase involved in cell wall biosynthesis